jgi:uncharacterized membrane protein YbhN (UPF0104 family)
VRHSGLDGRPWPAVGASPELAPIWMAYLIGQLRNCSPIPGGSAGPSSGSDGALIRSRLPVVTASAAVQLYRVIKQWIPPVLGSARWGASALCCKSRPRLTFELSGA